MGMYFQSQIRIPCVDPIGIATTCHVELPIICPPISFQYFILTNMYCMNLGETCTCQFCVPHHHATNYCNAFTHWTMSNRCVRCMGHTNIDIFNIFQQLTVDMFNGYASIRTLITQLQYSHGNLTFTMLPSTHIQKRIMFGRLSLQTLASWPELKCTAHNVFVVQTMDGGVRSWSGMCWRCEFA